MRKSTSIILCILILFNLNFSLVKALTPVEEAGDYLKKLGIYEGYEDGSLRLEQNITRTEFAVLAVRLIGKVSEEPDSRGNTIFKDVAASFWGTGYINIAVANGLLIGDTGTGNFRPQGAITYAEAITVLVRLLGYENTIRESNWPENFINKAEELGLLNNMDISPGKPITRGQIAVLIYNALDVIMLPS